MHAKPLTSVGTFACTSLRVYTRMEPAMRLMIPSHTHNPKTARLSRLVVKNGSKIRARSCGLMPLSLSAMETSWQHNNRGMIDSSTGWGDEVCAFYSPGRHATRQRDRNGVAQSPRGCCNGALG